MTLAQQDLVEAHMDLVRKIAGRHAKSLPPWVEMDEIIAAGYLGLCQAAHRFDSSRHASFSVWASWRIHGAIMDAFEGPRYPRRYVELPQAWTDGEIRSPEGLSGKMRNTESYAASLTYAIPEHLIDRSSPLEELIEREQCVVVCIDAARARKTLTPEEGPVIDGHIAGSSLTVIAAKLRISRSQAHKHLTVAKRKMRAELDKAA